MISFEFTINQWYTKLKSLKYGYIINKCKNIKNFNYS